MVLDHIAQRTRTLIERPAAFNPDLLRRRDLHVIDVVPVPHRLEDPISEPEHQDVLHRLLAQVVIDAEDLVLAEDRVDIVIQLARRLQVMPERLLDDAVHRALLRLRHLVVAKLLHDVGEILRRHRQVKQPVALRAVLLVDLLERLL